MSDARERDGLQTVITGAGHRPHQGIGEAVARKVWAKRPRPPPRGERDEAPV